MSGFDTFEDRLNAELKALKEIDRAQDSLWAAAFFIGEVLAWAGFFWLVDLVWPPTHPHTFAGDVVAGVVWTVIVRVGGVWSARRRYKRVTEGKR